MTRTSRIPPAEISGPFGAIVKAMSRRKLGSVPESLGVMWHSRPVLVTTSRAGMKAARQAAVSLAVLLRAESAGEASDAERATRPWCSDRLLRAAVASSRSRP